MSKGKRVQRGSSTPAIWMVRGEVQGWNPKAERLFLAVGRADYDLNWAFRNTARVLGLDISALEAEAF